MQKRRHPLRFRKGGGLCRQKPLSILWFGGSCFDPFPKIIWIVQFQKKSIPTPRKVIGNSYREGGLKSQNFRSNI